MRIIYVLSSLNPGGAERQQVEVLLHLRDAGHDVGLILPHGPGEMPGNLLGYVQSRDLNLYNLITYPDKIQAMSDVMREFGADVVLSCGYPMTLEGSLAAYKADVPLRVIRYENTGHTREQFPTDWRWELAGHLVTHRFVGNSQAVVDSFDKYEGINEHRSVINNAVDIPALSKATRDASRRHWGAGDSKLVGLLANHREDGIKNQMMLVRAARIVVEQYPDTKFLLVGYQTGYTAKLLTEITTSLLLDKVFLPGRIEDLDLIAGWDIAVNCSHTEGLSNAVMQGMAYGIPTIATAVGGNVELVDHGKTGYLVDDDDYATLAAAICQMLADPKQAKVLGAAGRRKMKDNNNWDEIVSKWAALFQDGLNEVVRDA